MTHLAEHLVMTQIGLADDANGVTEPFRESFIRRGSPEDCARFVRDVCAALAEPRLDRLDDEVTVIRTEAAHRGFGVVDRLIALRFGYGELGSVGMPELFVRNRDPVILRDWMEAHFVAANAAVWVAGALPAELHMALDRGIATARPPFHELDAVRTPSWVAQDGPAVVASFIVEPSAAVTNAFGAFERRLRQALRVERGLSYDVSGDSLPLDDRRSLVYMLASCLPDSVSMVQRTMLEVLDALASDGPTAAELKDQTDALLHHLEDPLEAPARLELQVERFLLGRELLSTAGLVEQQLDLQPGQVAQALREAIATLVLLVPEGPGQSGPPPPRFHAYPEPSSLSMGAGRTFSMAGAGIRLPGRAVPVLTVTGLGLAIDLPTGRAATVPWSDCVAVVQDPSSRDLFGRDGTAITIAAEMWKNGSEAIHAIDELAPAELIVPPLPPGLADTGGDEAEAVPPVPETRRGLFGLERRRTWQVTLDGQQREVVVVYEGLLGWMSIEVDGQRRARGWREFQSAFGGATLAAEVDGHRIEARVTQPYMIQEYSISLTIDGQIQSGSDALPTAARSWATTLAIIVFVAILGGIAYLAVSLLT
jgi:hypothetical protein